MSNVIIELENMKVVFNQGINQIPMIDQADWALDYRTIVLSLKGGKDKKKSEKLDL